MGFVVFYAVLTGIAYEEESRQNYKCRLRPESLRACAEKRLRRMFCFHAIFVSRLALSEEASDAISAQSDIIGAFLRSVDTTPAFLTASTRLCVLRRGFGRERNAEFK